MQELATVPKKISVLSQVTQSQVPDARVRGGPGGGDRSPKTLKMYICHVPEVLMWPKAGLAGLRLDCMLTSNPNLRSASAGWVALLVTCPHEPHLHHSYHTD